MYNDATPGWFYALWPLMGIIPLFISISLLLQGFMTGGLVWAFIGTSLIFGGARAHRNSVVNRSGI